MKNVLVTGGSGLLGNNLVRELEKQGYSVKAAVRKSTPREPFAETAAELVEIDFNQADSIARALQGIDTVIHSAGFIWFGWKKLKQSREINVGITSRIGNACLDKGIRMVHVSSLDALPVGYNKEILDESSLDERSNWNSKVPCNYVVSKTEADVEVKKLFELGMPGSIVHPGLMFGPNDWKPSSGELIQAITRLGFWFSCPTGGASVTDVRDVARATISAAANPASDGKHYILAGHNIPFQQLSHKIADKCNVSRARGRTGPIAYVGASIIGGVLGVFGRESIVNTAAIRMARLWNYYSSERAIAELGYQISDLDETLDDAIEWLFNQQMIQIRTKKTG